MNSELLRKKWQDPIYREHMKKAHLGQKVWNKGKKTGLVPKSAFKKGHNAGVLHPNWQGDKVNYRDLHNWIVKWRGQPDSCENCGRTNLKGHSIHWANVDHKYRRVLEDYIRLCAKCHKQYDKRFK